MQSIGEHISRVKNNYKLTNADAVATNRFIYLLMKKHRDFVVKRDRLSKIIYQDNLFQKIKYEELIEVDSIEACQIDSECTIKRTKNKIPKLIENSYGVILRWVGSLDGTKETKQINSNAFQRKQKKATFKYNNENYYWYANGYLYFPNTEWDAVSIDGYFDEDVIDDCEKTEGCKSILDNMFRIPDYLVSSMDQLVYQDLSVYTQIPRDEALNNNENLK